MKLIAKSFKLVPKEELPEQGNASPKNRQRGEKPKKAFKKLGRAI